MESVSQLLDKPEYFWRPIQILHRLRFKPSNDIALFRLAWGGSIYACSSDEIGRNIATLGVYDLALTEALIRLICRQIAATLALPTNDPALRHTCDVRVVCVSLSPIPPTKQFDCDGGQGLSNQQVLSARNALSRPYKLQRCPAWTHSRDGDRCAGGR